MKPPLDTDRVIPDVPKREAATARVLKLLPAELAEVIWDEIIGPLYDSRAMRVDWRRGDCIRCGIPHPALWAGTLAARYGTPWPGHRQECPKYVGPLAHQPRNGHQGTFGWRCRCSCGQTWLEYDGNGNKRDCPDAALDWRGPRPENGARSDRSD